MPRRRRVNVGLLGNFLRGDGQEGDAGGAWCDAPWAIHICSRPDMAFIFPDSRPEPLRPPLALLGSEPLRAAAEFLALKARGTVRAPRGDGHPVVIFPGLASDAYPLVPLRNFCRTLGYTAHDWGRGRNIGPRGDIDAWLARLADDVHRLVSRHGGSPTLIGWSLGGIYARELAKMARLGVRQVITIGTPFAGGPTSTHAGWLYQLLNGAPAVIDPALRLRLRTPPAVPTTSIYSRTDGVVAWQACCHDRPRARLEDIEVSGSHIGMGWNRQVLAIIGNRLAQPADGWRPYAASARTGAGEPDDELAVAAAGMCIAAETGPRWRRRPRSRGTAAAGRA